MFQFFDEILLKQMPARVIHFFSDSASIIFRIRMSYESGLAK